MMIYGQGQQITILADPDHPARWKDEPYRSQIDVWARQAEQDGGYLVAFWRNEIFKA